MGNYTDYCTVGNIGSAERLEFTIIGRGVNIASRPESTAAPDDVLMSFETYAYVRHYIECVEAGDVKNKGFVCPVEAYRVEDPNEQDTPAT